MNARNKKTAQLLILALNIFAFTKQVFVYESIIQTQDHRGIKCRVAHLLFGSRETYPIICIGKPASALRYCVSYESRDDRLGNLEANTAVVAGGRRAKDDRKQLAPLLKTIICKFRDLHSILSRSKLVFKSLPIKIKSNLPPQGQCCGSGSRSGRIRIILMDPDRDQCIQIQIRKLAAGVYLSEAPSSQVVWGANAILQDWNLAKYGTKCRTPVYALHTTRPPPPLHTV